MNLNICGACCINDQQSQSFPATVKQTPITLSVAPKFELDHHNVIEEVEQHAEEDQEDEEEDEKTPDFIDHQVQEDITPLTMVSVQKPPEEESKDV